MKKQFKERLVLIVELAIGMKIEDYLYDRTSRGREPGQMVAELNEAIDKCSMKAMKKHKLLHITGNNIWRWCGKFGYPTNGIKGLKKGTKKNVKSKRV